MPSRATCLALALLLPSCGNVVFVDPNADLKEALSLGVVERLVVEGDPRGYFHVRIGSRTSIERVELSISSPEGFFDLPLTGAHQQDCGIGETCLSITRPPGLPETADRLVLSVPEIGHEVGANIVVRRLGPHDLFGEALDENQKVEVTIVDPIRRFYAVPEEVFARVDGEDIPEGATLLFPRDFEVFSAPGACAGRASPKAPGWAAVEGSPFETPSGFSEGDDPLSCARIRPALPAGGDEVAHVTITARADIRRFEHLYTPPVENSPLVFLPMFDLELPSLDRCNEAQSLVAQAILDAATEIASTAGEGSEILALPPVQIAETDGIPCRQENRRSFSPGAVAGDIRSALLDAFGEERAVRVIIIYAANLDIPPPEDLVQAFNSLFDSFRLQGGLYELYFFGIAPENALAGFMVDRVVSWVATEEPSFRRTITDVLRNIWPFQSSLHSFRTVVPLVTAADAADIELYKICSSQMTVVELGTDLYPNDADLDIFVPPAAGPAYQVVLTDQQLVEQTMFVRTPVQIIWEACMGLCDRPAPRAVVQQPWSRTPGCASAP